MNRVEACLEDLENRIDPALEDRLLEEWTAFTEGRFSGDIFAPKRIRRIPPGVDWPTVSVNRAQLDLDAMVLQQYGACSNQLGGGAVHFCGRGSHYIASCCSMEGLYAINLSQPHLNEMETVYRNTVDKGIRLLGFDRAQAQVALAAGRPLRGCVHCH